MRANWTRKLALIALLAGAMAAAYALGRWPGPLAKWEGKWPMVWQHAVMPKPKQAGNDASGQSANDSGPLRLKDAFDRLAQIANGSSKEDYEGIIYNLKPMDLPALFKMLGTLPPSVELGYIKTVVLNTIADSNLDLALKLSGNDDETLRLALINDAMAAMGDKDIGKALQMFAQVPPAERLAVFKGSGLIYALDYENMPKLAALLADAPATPQDREVLDQLAEDWGEHDPAAAAKWLTSLSANSVSVYDDYNNQVFAGIVRELAERDPQQAAAYLDQTTDPDTRGKIIGAVSLAMASGNLIISDQLNANGERATDQTPPNPAGAIQWLNQAASGKDYDDAVSDLIFRCINNRISPAVMAGVLDQIPDARIRAESYNSVAENWAEMGDPAAALAWVATVPESSGASQVQLVNDVLEGWASHDPGGAAQFVKNAPDPSLYLDSATSISIGMAYTSTTDALAFAQSLPEGPDKDDAVAGVINRMGFDDPTTAWTTAVNLPAGGGRDEAMTYLVDREIQKDVAQAAAMLGQYDPGQAQQAEAKAVATAWVKQDPQALSQWLNTLGPGALQDAAIPPLVQAQAGRDPAGAFNWANAMSDPAARAQQVLMVAVKWAESDPAEALNAVASANLSPAQRAAVTAAVQQAANK